MKKRLAALIVFLAMTLTLLVGCSTLHRCDICGQTKLCEKKEVLGRTFYICDDCDITDNISNFFGSK
ncbi:MAG: hypothetical protein II458_03330 [Oscillospiraceae bacterium]|nr:hypothetical protein [Oscillospiraceae bacterium]